MILGITSQNHDASLALIDGKDILWAAHSERYSRIKNDNLISLAMLKDLQNYGIPKEVVWFEKPLSKNLRRLYSGQRPWKIDPKEEIKKLGLSNLPIHYVKHHESHAAAGFYTSGFQSAAVLVVDAIGEWNTVTIWNADRFNLQKIYSKNYPDSIGLFYTAITQYAKLKPNEEEYILMGMAAFGKPIHVDEMKSMFFEKWNPPNFKLKHNLHQGCLWWKNNYDIYDIAASAQAIVEEYLLETVKWIKKNTCSKNLVFMGGVALNCVANAKIAQLKLFDNIWIMPNPGDAGSAIGAVAALKREHLNWQGPYLGLDIKRTLAIDHIVNDLLKGKVVAIANGRAEFGPRALGNRSLLCDPRGPDAKQRMNALKKREKFRPFAPAVLEEHASDWFDMPVDKSPYMQFVAECKRKDTVPGICHVDGTSRVQTVSFADNKTFRELLERWYEKTGCPMLMNTSLNIKGEPLVNSWHDALRWEKLNNVKIY